ncbi:MAG: hypothetical protein ACRC5H_06515 [Treponemataceae bacterium]
MDVILKPSRNSFVGIMVLEKSLSKGIAIVESSIFSIFVSSPA